MNVSCTVRVIRETRLDPGFPLSRHELTELVEVVLETLGLTDSSLAIKLVDDGEISRLNAQFMGCTGPTNVLSFPAQDNDDQERGAVENGECADTLDESDFLGELALSVDAVARETALYGQSPVEHLARLLAHGILHLAGHDHGDVMYGLTDVAVDRVLLEYTDCEEV